MSASRVSTKVQAIDTWRRRPVYRARIVNSDTSAVSVNAAGGLRVGKRIAFARLSDLDHGTLREWRSAVIWRIDNDCLHLTRT